MSNGPFAVALLISAMATSGCGGTPTAPTPSSPTPGGPIPVLRAVTVDRTTVDAGDEIIALATLEGAAPAGARYVWSVQPDAGVLSPDGSTAHWRAPVDDPVPATYVLSVTLVHSSGMSLATTSGTVPASSGVASSPPVTVNDARREMDALGAAFLKDAADVNVAPEMCVRNFTTSCAGRQTVLDDLALSRATYSAQSVTFEPQFFLRSVEWPDCVAPDRSARCAVVIYRVEWTRTRRADGAQERIAGDEYLQGFYERSRWWLCGAWFEAK